MYCQSRLCLEGKQLGGRQAQNCNVILAAIFTGEKGGGGEIKKTKKNIGGLKLVRHCGVNTTENNDPELRFIGTESGTSLITKGQMSSLLAVSLVAGGAAFFFFSVSPSPVPPSVSSSPSLSLTLFFPQVFCMFYESH